jgi:hypothetical protein
MEMFWSRFRRNRQMRHPSRVSQGNQPELSCWTSMWNPFERRLAKRVASQDMPESAQSLTVREGGSLIVRRTSALTSSDDDGLAAFRFCQCQQCRTSFVPFIDMA